MTDWIDGQGRQIDYLRLSVTDRCDFRCVYCMAEDMRFLPRQQVLTLEEIERVARLFVAGGVRKLRLTGGEPLVRPGIVGLCERLAALPGLRELCMTSNGSQLVRYARPLYDAGLSRLNISLDTLDPLRFRAITRNGELDKVLAGIDAAQAAGFRRIKLNAVVMKGRNADEVPALVDFAIARGLDISFIEEMPLGQVGRERGESFCSSDEVRALIAQRHALLDSAEQSGGPARYVRLVEHERRLRRLGAPPAGLRQRPGRGRSSGRPAGSRRRSRCCTARPRKTSRHNRRRNCVRSPSCAARPGGRACPARPGPVRRSGTLRYSRSAPTWAR